MKATNGGSGAGAILAVRVSTRSRKPGIGGVRDGVLAVAVSSPPERGRATEEARRAVAAWLGVAVSGVTLAGGATARDKRFRISGISASDLRKRLAERTGGGSSRTG